MRDELAEPQAKKTSGLGGKPEVNALIRIKAPLREEDERSRYFADGLPRKNPTKVGDVETACETHRLKPDLVDTTIA